MKRFGAAAWRILKALPLALASPVLLAIAALGLLLADGVLIPAKGAFPCLPGQNRQPPQLRSSFPTGTAAICSRSICPR